MWLTKLKIAIVEKNTDALAKLLEEMPELSDVQEMREAMYLLAEASELLHTLKDETAASMEQVQKNISFLRSTETQSSNKLDIKS
ncbi:MAG: hypothetical protein U9Q62_00430 [Campylobacterota bacterium]|nr:hypothetical protein [Campylobacterota bacterium]